MALNKCIYYSKILQKNNSFNIIIPDNFRIGKNDLQIIWLLHGLGGDQDDFIKYSNLLKLSQENPAIYIMPNGGRSFYQNMAYGYDYYELISNELPRILHANYGINCRNYEQNVIGVSMGGYGAMKYAFDKVTNFKHVVSISGSLDIVSRDAYKRSKNDFIAKEWNLIFGEELSAEFDLFKYDISQLKSKIILTCGTKDHLYQHNKKFEMFLKDNSVNYQFIEYKEGKHDWTCFSQAFDEIINLIGSNNARNS